MIGYLKGKILELTNSNALILTSSGIGYDVIINEHTYSSLISHTEIELFIYNQISENTNNLFGFINLEEKNIFIELIKIGGVGGKVGQQILSMGIDNLINAIKSENNKQIEGIKGIGKKMASKIILELKDKDFVKTYVGSEKNTKVNNDILNTLVGMGFDANSVSEVLSELPDNLESTERILAYTIKELGK